MGGSTEGGDATPNYKRENQKGYKRKYNAIQSKKKISNYNSSTYIIDTFLILHE